MIRNMADEKWIAGLRGDMPVSAAARLALAVRLGAVRDRLPAAVFHPFADIEHVHQLRVSTRRAAAALRLFADCLPPRLDKKARKSLRSLRRSAGAARDWDVFLDMVKSRLGKAQTKHRSGLLYLFGYARGLRDLAQEELYDAHTAKAEAFGECIDEIAGHLQSVRPAKATLRSLAAAKLTELLRELEEAACADLQSYEALHQVRILGKQLRYAMEIFESCFGPEFRQQYYPAIEEMQDVLGLANDSFTACRRLTAIRTQLMSAEPTHVLRFEGGIDLLLKFHERRLPQQKQKFEKWWRAWLKSGAERTFAELIQAPS